MYLTWRKWWPATKSVPDPSQVLPRSVCLTLRKRWPDSGGAGGGQETSSEPYDLILSKCPPQLCQLYLYIYMCFFPPSCLLNNANHVMHVTLLCLKYRLFQGVVLSVPLSLLAESSSLLITFQFCSIMMLWQLRGSSGSCAMPARPPPYPITSKGRA